MVCKLCGRAFRAISGGHLVYKHGFDPEHPILEYVARFRLAHWMSRISRRRLRKSIRRALEAKGKRWTRERVVREIQRRRRVGEGLSASAVLRSHEALYIEARRFFRSWYSAVASAGVDPEQVRINLGWSKEAVIRAIRRERRAGRNLTSTSVDVRWSALANAARRYWGSWSEALCAAGLDPDKIRKCQRWTSALVLRMVRAINGSTAARTSALRRAARRYFGSWANAVAISRIQSP